MSCNGCRVLRKGCSETCVLRTCLQCIESPEAQGHATVFVAKFFGRAGLMSFISAVPENQRPALFQSLLFEAAGRTVNPVTGAVGLLWTGNWHVCQAAVETVLRGGALKPVRELLGGASPEKTDDASECCADAVEILNPPSRKRPYLVGDDHRRQRHQRAKNVTQLADLDLSLMPRGRKPTADDGEKKRRLGSPSMNSEESVTTTCGGEDRCRQPQVKLLNLFHR